MDAKEVVGQYAEGKRDFVGANLSRADLGGANLSRANLSRANLSGAIGIYAAFSLHASDSHYGLFGGVEIVDDKLELFLMAGCQRGNATYMRQYIKKHPKGLDVGQCELAIKYIEDSFTLDMAAGRWDYLLELNKETAE